jgi:hypothetical protein
MRPFDRLMELAQELAMLPFRQIPEDRLRVVGVFDLDRLGRHALYPNARAGLPTGVKHDLNRSAG